MDSSGGKPPSKLQLQIQGPRPSPLSVHKDSIKKLPLPQPQPQPTIYCYRQATVVQTNANDFRTIVQRLTGLTSGDFSGDGNVSPAARLASTEQTIPSAEREKFGHVPGILSPAPETLPPVSEAYFSLYKKKDEESDNITGESELTSVGKRAEAIYSDKIKSMKEEEWDAKEIHLMDNELYELPESPNCPSLIALYLQRNYDLTIIPPLFFEHMPVLQVLDLSHTSIKSLPGSLPKLVALRKLLLRGCGLFMELSPQVGELKNLEELDLDETQIIYLPVEIGKLVKLKRLKVSFYGDMKCSKKRLQSSTVIHTGVISNLSQLTELSIDVSPDDERWNATVEAIIEEVCSSKMLNTLSLYLPKVELLNKLGMGNASLIYHPCSRFSFVVGHHKRRIISRVPHEVEARFNEWDKCLKFVNGRDIPDEIKKVLKNATAFYLERSAAAVNLSEFGIENMKKLNFCILAECNEIQTIIDGGEFISGEEKEDRRYLEFKLDSAEEVVLGSLLYLGIYYMNNLRSIWKGPIRQCCLSNLKLLAIHTCPKLSTIFSVRLLANLIKLEELIVEDCPQVICLVSHTSSHPTYYLPSLRRISLLFLPELVCISRALHIAPKLERIGFYYCPKLENVSTKELSSKNLKAIKGERKWWDKALKWNESDWGCRPYYLNDIFCEIDEEKDVRTQLTEQ